MDSRRIAELFRIRSGGVADYIWRKLVTPGASLLDVGARRELLARFKAVLRRAGAKAEAKTDEAEGAPVSEARFGNCRLDLDVRKLFDADGGARWAAKQPPAGAGSTLITSAPRLPRIMVQDGPARARVKSRTRMPARGPVALFAALSDEGIQHL